MKRIMTKSRLEKKQKRNQMILGIILIFVMFGSVFGIIVNSFGEDSENNKVIYNDFEFFEQNGFWFTSKDNLNFVFRNNPIETEEIKNNLSSLDYMGKPLYIYSESQEAELEILRNLFYENRIVERIQNACLDEESDIFNMTINCQGDFPIKDCSNSFIIIRESNYTEIVQEDNCVFINGEKENLTQITDEFLFNVFEIRV